SHYSKNFKKYFKHICNLPIRLAQGAYFVRQDARSLIAGSHCISSVDELAARNCLHPIRKSVSMPLAPPQFFQYFSLKASNILKIGTSRRTSTNTQQATPASRAAPQSWHFVE
ncbi:hypothetical protein Tcan_00507, partial [Toxocara canis]